MPDDYIDRFLEERDRRYTERFEAQNAALNAAFLAADKAVQAALLAAEKAVIKAEVAAERRFESVNEFRGQLADQAKTFLPRQEYDVQHAALNDKVDALAKGLAERLEAESRRINELSLGLVSVGSDSSGRRLAATEGRVQSNWQIGLAVTVAIALLAAGITIATFVLR